MEIDGKVAVVTGAAVGTGRAIACRLAAAGAAVVVADVDLDGGGQTARLIESCGGRAAVIRADVRSEADAAAMADFAVARFGSLDVLVNNAGGVSGAGFPAATPAQWGAVLDVNLRGPMLATQAALPHMRRSGRGVIVNISSVAALGEDSHPAPEYAAAKAGLIRLTTALAGLPESTGVRVNCVVPDWMGTDRAYRELAVMTREQRAGVPTPIPLSALTDLVDELIRDDNLSGHIAVLRPPSA